MFTYLAAIAVSESGSVTSETYIDTANRNTDTAMSHYGSPYLGEYVTSEAWREALMNYAQETVETIFGAKGCHGGRLAYVDSQCSLYVFEIDFEV